MSLNIGAIVQRGLGIAKNLGVAGDVTITRASGSPTSFTCNGTWEADKDAPASDGLSPNRPRTVTVAAADCDFAPETGHLLASAALTYRVINAKPIVPDGVTPVAYEIEVTT